jgi:uncharacterized membrane protein
MNQKGARDSWTDILLPSALILGLVLLLSFGGKRVSGEEAVANPQEQWLQLVISYFATGAEIAAALVIGVAVVRAIGCYLYQLIGRTDVHSNNLESIRLRLGRVLALGLEFTIASDILKTVVAPRREEIMNLGAIVLLRSLLNYFLEMEISMGEVRSPVEVSTDKLSVKKGTLS